MGVKVVQLTSASHHENILASLHQLRLQGQLSDVTVQVDYQGDVQEFQAHQVMLAASSGYFKKLLLSQDVARDKLSLSNMRSRDFSKFLEFVYTGKVEVARDKIGDVQAVAQFLDCEDLSEVCVEAMSAGILQQPRKRTSVSKVVATDDLHGAKTEKKTKGKKQPKSLPLKRQLSPQSSEKEVASKRIKAKNTATEEKRPGRQLKMRLAGHKVLQRRWYQKKEASGSEVTNEDAEEDEDKTEAEAQPENKQDKGEESSEEEEDEEEDEEEEGQSSDTVKRTSKAQFQCNKCQRTFHYERSYLKHISTYHGVKADVVFRCETCQQTFANRSNLKIHEKHVHSNERLFSCDSCTKTFKRKKDVVRHQRQVHERNLRHVCSECGKALSSKTALLLHERTHTGTKPFECTDCGARFTQNSALKMHRRTHTGEKPFACDECDARFTQKHMLAYHKRSHTGEKPFMCEACGKSFASKEYLRHHSNIHTGSKPYKCDQCGRGFAQRNSLNQHLKIHTGNPYVGMFFHGALGGITVIHTEVPPGTQIQPIVTTDGTGASVISLDGSAIPFTLPVSMAHGVPLSDAASTSLSVSTLSVPVSESLLASVSEIPTVSTSSVLEAAASQTILAPVSDTKVISEMDTLPPNVHTVIVGDNICVEEQTAADQSDGQHRTADDPLAEHKTASDQDAV
uniref:GDNF inducible zinc finger protein 1 n=1 Tax=Stegastes partitus TaxID=144197 RepID=A0A3B5APY4_9TELE